MHVYAKRSVFMDLCIIKFTYIAVLRALSGNYFSDVTYCLRNMDCNLY